MPYIPPDVVAQARKMDLLTYLRSYEPDELVPFSRDTYCTRTHDSLKISNGKWFWFSRGIGGASALDYLIKVRGIPFTQAVEQIMGMAATQPPSFFMPKRPVPRVLLLPRASPCTTHAVTYLTGRGIDPEIIDFCIRSGRLYESTPHHNVVFVGLDSAGKPAPISPVSARISPPTFPPLAPSSRSWTPRSGSASSTTSTGWARKRTSTSMCMIWQKKATTSGTISARTAWRKPATIWRWASSIAGCCT